MRGIRLECDFYEGIVPEVNVSKDQNTYIQHSTIYQTTMEECHSDLSYLNRDLGTRNTWRIYP